MTTTTGTATPRATPWWFWIVAGVSLLWNAFGGFDYTMSHVQGDAYMRSAGMTEPQIAFIAAYPTWMHAVWAVGVWGSVVGSLLLLARSGDARVCGVHARGGGLAAPHRDGAGRRGHGGPRVPDCHRGDLRAAGRLRLGDDEAGCAPLEGRG